MERGPTENPTSIAHGSVGTRSAASTNPWPARSEPAGSELEPKRDRRSRVTFLLEFELRPQTLIYPKQIELDLV